MKLKNLNCSRCKRAINPKKDLFHMFFNLNSEEEILSYYFLCEHCFIEETFIEVLADQYSRELNINLSKIKNENY